MRPAVRIARPEDERALATLDLVTWSLHASPASPPPPDKAFFNEHSAPEDTLVAILNGALVGYVKLAPASSLEAERHVLEIHGLAVDPAHRRRGIGRRLIHAARNEATARGARRLTLRVLAPNIGARNLYADLGFAVEGVLRAEFRIGGHYVDDVLMAVDLSTSDDSAR